MFIHPVNILVSLGAAGRPLTASGQALRLLHVYKDAIHVSCMQALSMPGIIDLHLRGC